jgi:hypothetical protein
MKFIDFRKPVARFPIDDIVALWRECTPKLLVVTDGLNYLSSSGFGLSQFVATLRGATIHGMTPIVITAQHNPSAAAPIAYDATARHITNFKFDDATHGVLKSRYDVVFLLGINRTGIGAVPAAGLNAIGKFMQQGGGVFATGDHEDLGTALCGGVPRVRSMRYWQLAETPNFGNTSRLSTNLSGDNGSEEFADQSDRHPQRLYLNFRTSAGGAGSPHPIMQIPGNPPTGRAIEVFPDHPHEGECRIPTNLTTSFTVDGTAVDEWPVAAGAASRVVPEIVALSVSHGDGFPGKDPLVPRSFVAVAAYDGQRANVGRVVTDATWHHFVNINLDGTGEPGYIGLRNPPAMPGGTPTDTPELARIRQYYRNLATWLMPKAVRRCLRFPLVVAELARFPLFEELHMPELAEAKGADFFEIGRQVYAALRRRVTPFEAETLLADGLDDAVGLDRAAKLRALGERHGRVTARDAGLAALGGLTVGAAAKLAEVVDLKEIDADGTFEPVAHEAARIAVKRYIDEARTDLRALDEALEVVAD